MCKTFIVLRSTCGWRLAPSLDIIQFLMSTSLLEDVVGDQLLTNIVWCYPLNRGRQKVLYVMLSFYVQFSNHIHCNIQYIFITNVDALILQVTRVLYFSQCNPQVCIIKSAKVGCLCTRKIDLSLNNKQIGDLVK